MIAYAHLWQPPPCIFNDDAQLFQTKLVLYSSAFCFNLTSPDIAQHLPQILIQERKSSVSEESACKRAYPESGRL